MYIYLYICIRIQYFRSESPIQGKLSVIEFVPHTNFNQLPSALWGIEYYYSIGACDLQNNDVPANYFPCVQTVVCDVQNRRVLLTKGGYCKIEWKKVLMGSLLRAVSRFAPSQWERVLLCNDVSHWLGEGLESALLLSGLNYNGVCCLLIEAEWRIYAPVNSDTIGSNNGLTPVWHQAIIWTSGDLLLTRPSGSNLNKILFEIQIFSLKKLHLKILSAKWRPFYLGLHVLNGYARQSGNESINFI